MRRQGKAAMACTRGVRQPRRVLATAAIVAAATVGGDLTQSCVLWLDVAVRAELEEGYYAKVATLQHARAR
jgi:hypothetical protein